MKKTRLSKTTLLLLLETETRTLKTARAEMLKDLTELSIHMRGKCEHETPDDCNDYTGEIVSKAIAKLRAA